MSNNSHESGQKKKKSTGARLYVPWGLGVQTKLVLPKWVSMVTYNCVYTVFIISNKVVARPLCCQSKAWITTHNKFSSIGMNVLFSGGVDEFSLSYEAYGTIIPAFVSALVPLKPRYPYPPDPQVYEGTYKFAQLATIEIDTYDQQLLLTAYGTVTQKVFLSYQEPLLLQVLYELCVNYTLHNLYSPHCMVLC